MRQKHRPIAVGDEIHGFARGLFGRDSYQCKIVAAVGDNWAKLASEDGMTAFYMDQVEDLIKLMEVRDEVRCPHEDDGGTCGLESLIRLTTAGGFIRDPRR